MIDIDLISPKLPIKLSGKQFLGFSLSTLFLLIILPWYSFTVGSGQVTAIDPNERVQTITTPINGFIKEWHVKEGDVVKANDLLATLVDNDPSLLERLNLEKDASKAAENSSKLMMETARINLERQKKLFEEGLSPRKEYEKAKIEYSKLVVDYQKSLVTTTKSESQISKQIQEVRAPRDGVIVRVFHGERGHLIKSGTPIIVFSPDVTKKAVEVWISGNDSALLSPGMSARVQFEGWPSIQIPGWPSVAINTFKAKVYLVDQASSYQGMFRVILIEDEAWPSQKLLRLGAKARAYISLQKTNVIWEIWRQLNSFPPVVEPIKDELNKLMESKKDDSSQEEGMKK